MLSIRIAKIVRDYQGVVSGKRWFLAGLGKKRDYPFSYARLVFGG